MKYAYAASKAASLVVVLAVFFSGCTPALTAAPAETEQPAMQSFIDPTPAGETAQPITLENNPVSGLYAAYDEAASASVDSFYSYLTYANTIDNIAALIRLSDHEALLTKAQVSAGRLTSDGSSFYSDTLIGAATGYGTMSSKDGLYSFYFMYDTGETLLGSMQDERIDFVYTSPDGIPANVTLGFQNGVWISSVRSYDQLSVLETDGSRVRFGFCPMPEATPVPTPEPTPTPRADEDDAGSAETAPEASPTPAPTQPLGSFAAMVAQYPELVVFDSLRKLPAPSDDLGE